MTPHRRACEGKEERPLIDSQRTKVHVRHGEGGRCCTTCHGKTGPGEETRRELHMSARCDGEDPGTVADDARLKIKAGSGHQSPDGIACTRPRTDSSWPVARCSASSQPSFKKTEAVGEPGGQPRRNLPQRRNAELSKRRAGGDETRSSAEPQELLSNTKEVKSVDANRKGRRSDLHHSTHWAKKRFPRDTRC